MFCLTALFKIIFPLWERPLVMRDWTEELKYRATLDEFEVVLDLNPRFQGNSHLVNSKNAKPYHAIPDIEIIVSRNEAVGPSDIQILEGQTASEVQRKYLYERLPAYRNVAAKTLQNALLFFKYKLHNPQLVIPSPNNEEFMNPIWMEPTGNEINPHGAIGVCYPLPNQGSFSIQGLKTSDDDALNRALSEPIKPELHEELLSDAQTAIFQGNLRRGALEMAIACEVAVKQFFFAEGTIAGAAYEHLESKQMITVTIPELIGKLAKDLFNESFKDRHPSNYYHIEYLFRCRNKIAHLGKTFYKDNKSTVHEIDFETLKQWWESVDIMLHWLKSLSLKS